MPFIKCKQSGGSEDGKGENCFASFLLVCFSPCEVIDDRLGFICTSAADMAEGHRNTGFKCSR